MSICGSLNYSILNKRSMQGSWLEGNGQLYAAAESATAAELKAFGLIHHLHICIYSNLSNVKIHKSQE